MKKIIIIIFMLGAYFGHAQNTSTISSTGDENLVNTDQTGQNISTFIQSGKKNKGILRLFTHSNKFIYLYF